LNAAEKIQAAIERLEDLKARSAPGPRFLTYESATHPRVWGNADYNNADHVATTARSPHDAELIVTLHRMIDPNLDYLRHALARGFAKAGHGGIAQQVWSHERDAIALAEAILA
jgi:hypothetical protein